MTNRQQLDRELVNAILAHLNVNAEVPCRRLLENLVQAFVRTVPWESAFRIVRRAQCSDLELCPRWPTVFWHDHFRGGAGGTCFETNYAFYYLLKALNFDAYLTVNNMGVSIGCHTAIIVVLNEQKWLVDVGFPLYIILPVTSSGTVFRSSPILRYVVRPMGNNRYQIERRPHPKWYAFTLIDQPVSEEEYRQATTADYGPQGHFLDRVIIHKVIGQRLWRFNSTERPYQLEFFEYGQRGQQLLNEKVANRLANRFGMDKDVISLALSIIDDQIGAKGPKR